MEAVWRMRNGQDISVCAMDDRHLMNAFALLKRKGYVGARTAEFYAGCSEPHGEAALDAFYHECDYIFGHTHPLYDVLEDEIKRRGLVTT